MAWIRILELIFVVILISLILAFTGILPGFEEKNSADTGKTVYNYSSFSNNATESMVSKVENKLGSVNCNPSNFTYGNSSIKNSSEICFRCKDYNACFEYGLVRAGEDTKKISPKANSYLQGNFTGKQDFAFETLGVSDALNCKTDKIPYRCVEGVTAGRDNLGAYFESSEGVEEKQAVRIISSKLDARSCKFTELESTLSWYKCGELEGNINNGKIRVTSYRPQER